MSTITGALAAPVRTATDYTHSIFVTGAASGIGRAVTLVLLDRGFHVFAGAINDAEADSLRASFPPARVTPIVLDVRDQTSVAEAAKIVEKKLDGAKLKAVCNIAGVIVNGPLADLSGEAFANVLAVNLVGVHNVTRALLPLLGPGSRVVNMSSASGTRTLPFTGAYSASKFGLEALTTAMRMEFAPLGIQAVAVAPGLINTPMATKIQEQLAREPSMAVYAEPLKRFLTKSAENARNGIPIRLVTEAITAAITSDRPAPRYEIHHSYFQDAILMRLLPIKVRDAFVARVLGLQAATPPRQPQGPQVLTARTQIGRKVAVSAGSIHVHELGPETGRPIVLVHGFTHSMHWYDDLAALLSNAFRVVRVDLLGHGCSDPAARMDGPAQAAMLTELLETLDLKDAIVVGHSFGNDATVGAAVSSSRVGGVVILAQGADNSEVKYPITGWAMLTPVLGPLLHRATRPFMYRKSLGMMFKKSYQPTAATWDQAFSDFHAMHPSLYRALIIDRTRQLAARGLDVQLAESGLPALAILAQHDCFFDADIAQRRYAAVGARVAVLDTGHNIQVERPQEVADLIREFATPPGR